MKISLIHEKIKKLPYILLSYRFFIFSTAFSLSIYFLLVFGTIAQFYISQYGLYSCEYCFTKVNEFSEIISAKIDIPLLVVSMFIFLSSLLFHTRLKIYLTILLSSTVILTSFDYTIANETTRTASYTIENLMFNCFGSIFLSAFIIFNLASIQYTINIKKVSPIFASLIPLSSSFFICFLIYGFLYLIYERSPTHIDALLSNKIIGTIESSDTEFGYLTSPQKIKDEVNVTSILNNEFKWSSGSGNYDIHVFLYSGCIINSDNFEKNKTTPTIEYPDTSSLNFKTLHPVIYYIKGQEIKAKIKKSNSINNNKEDKITSNIKDGAVIFNSILHPYTLFINISPIEDNGFTKEINYTLTINGESQSIKNIIPPIKVDDHKQKIKCSILKSKNNRIKSVNTTYGVTSLAIEFIPKGEVNFTKESNLEIDVSDGSFTMDKIKNNPLYGFNNGKVKHINLIGLEELKIGGRTIKASSSDLFYATGENLTGYITNENEIKIFGMADQVAFNNKIMNLKPISMLNNKLSYLNTSIFDILKIVFSMGLTIYMARYILIFFRRNKEIDIMNG